MNDQQIKNLIQQNVGVPGAEGASIAEDAFDAAIDHVASLDDAPWNKEGATFTLTSGTGSYNLGESILSDYEDIRGITQLWYTDVQNHPIRLLSPSQFNSYGRGSTSTGRPTIATIHGRKKTLDLYPIPDSAYPVWGMLRFPLDVNDIPDEYKKILLWFGVLISSKMGTTSYEKAERMLNRIMESLKVDGLMSWDGSRIQPEYIVGNFGGSAGNADSGNFWGLT